MSRPIKATALICALCLLLTEPALAASWTVLQPADYIADSSRSDDGNIVTVTYNFATNPLITYKFKNVNGGYVTGTGSDSVTQNLSLTDARLPAEFQVYPLGEIVSLGYALSSPYSGGIAIDARDFKPNAAVEVYSTITLLLDYYYETAEDATRPDYTGINVRCQFYGYDSSGVYVNKIEDGDSFVHKLPLGGESELIPLGYSLDFSGFAQNVRYIVPHFYVSVGMPQDVPDIQLTTLQFSMPHFMVITNTDMLVKDSLTMEAIENQLEDLNDKQNQTNDKLDELLQQPEQEKQEASSGGQGAADQLTQAIPDYSQEFSAGIKDLVDAMSYEGIDAKFIFPSISLPAIPGVMKSYKLSDELEVDLGAWVLKLPDKILSLVQTLGTLALVVYCFKELYSLVSYAMTLNRRSG